MSTRYSEFANLELANVDRVVTVTLNNPSSNLVGPEAHGELASLFRQLSRDEEVDFIVLTGAGEFAFTLGGDVAAMDRMIADPQRWIASMIEAREIVSSLLDCDKPIIGRINGHAIGLGATLALCCDVTCMVEGAKIGDPHVKVGLAAGDGGAILWPSLVGVARARRHLLTGDPLTAAEAAAIGLVTESMPRDQLDARVDWWLERFRSLPRLAVRLTKRAINGDLRGRAEAMMDGLLGLQTLSYLADDHRARVADELTRLKPAPVAAGRE